MPQIDPTSRVAEGARLAADVEVGPFCTIGPDVELQSGVRLLSHVNLAGVTAIGAGTMIYPFASLGTPPQSNAYRGGATRLTIGRDCRIREGVTISTGTEDSGAITTVGDDCFLMANSHVGHDCHVGNGVTFANGAVLGGHVTVGDHAFLGGNSAVHQFVRIGEGAMIGGLSGITRDLIPFGFAFGPKADLVGLNIVGLRRRKVAREDLRNLRLAYRMLFSGDEVFAARLARAKETFAGNSLAETIMGFIDAGGSRPLMMAAAGGRGSDADAA